MANKIIGGIEIGTAKSVVLVGEVVDGRSLNIIGMGQSTTQGMKKGQIDDFGAVSDCTHAAINAAEKNAGARIEGVYLALTGSHLKGFFNRGAVTVSSSDNLVSDHDMERAKDEAKCKALPDSRIYIHHIQNGFRLDSKRVLNPRGMHGEQLEVGYWHVHGDEKMVSDQIHICNGFGLEVDDIIISSIASGCMVAGESEKENGALVIDIGRGATDYVLYRGGHISRTGVVPVGGDHLTNDLALGLRVSPRHAEKLKIQFGKAVIDREDMGDYVWLFGDLTIGDRRIPRKAIYQIINARVEEILQIVKKELGPAANPQDLSGGIILTGGTSRLPHICDIGKKVFGADTRLGDNPGWVRSDLRKPEYSAVLGLLYYGLTAAKSDTAKPRQKGIMRKITKLFAVS